MRAISKGREVGSLTLRYELRTEEGSAVDSEPATHAGTIAVLQRHAESAMRMMVQSFSGVIDSYKEQAQAQRELIAEFQRQATETFRTQEELASRKVERDLVVTERHADLELSALSRMSQINRQEHIWTEGIRQLGLLAPVVLHYLTNGQAGQSPENLAESRRKSQENDAGDAPVVPSQATPPTEEARALTEQASSGPSDAEISATTQRFYNALSDRTDELRSLAMSFVGKTPFSRLDEQQRVSVAGLASLSAGTVPHLLSPEHLWSALLSREQASILPVIEALNAKTPWAKVTRDPKIQLMALIRHAYESSRRGGVNIDDT